MSKPPRWVVCAVCGCRKLAGSPCGWHKPKREKGHDAPRGAVEAPVGEGKPERAEIPDGDEQAAPRASIRKKLKGNDHE